MRRVRIIIGPVELQAKLFDTPAADAIYERLPLISRATVTDGKVHFKAPARGGAESPGRDRIRAGELECSADGGSVGIGYEVSTQRRRRPARRTRPGNVWGRALGDIVALRHVEDGDPVTIMRVS